MGAAVRGVRRPRVCSLLTYLLPTYVPRTASTTCHLSPTRCAALAYAVLLASAFNYFAFAWAARRSSASHVTAFFPLQVVSAAALQVRACMHTHHAPPRHSTCYMHMLGCLNTD